MRPEDKRILKESVPDGRARVAAREKRGMDNPDYLTGDPEAVPMDGSMRTLTTGVSPGFEIQTREFTDSVLKTACPFWMKSVPVAAY
jgi:hypothetical protein